MNHMFSGAVILAFAMTASMRAATIDGTVTNKTTGKPSAGDKVALVDLSAGMADSSTATTDSAGHYALQATSAGTYLIRVNHQGASYFIAAPRNGSPADVTVYDVAAKLEEVGVDADMLLVEAGQGNLHVRERYLVRNSSSPPRTQFSENTFEIALPEGAQLEEAAATRPGGMGTRTHLVPLAQKGHYSFNVPIQPDLGEKETMFEVAYHFPYNGRYTLTVHPVAPADHLVVYTAKGIQFEAKDASRFKAAQEDARVETHVALNAHPGEDIAFTISGEGSMPPDASAAGMRFGRSRAGETNAGGGIGAPIGSPDPIAGSRGWLLLGGVALVAAAAFLILRWRKESQLIGQLPLPTQRSSLHQTLPSPASAEAIPRHNGSSALLYTLKEELFTLEQERISGRVSEEDYSSLRTGLEAVLKRALNTDRIRDSSSTGGRV